MSLRTPYQLGRNKRRPQVLHLSRARTPHTSRQRASLSAKRRRADRRLSGAVWESWLVRGHFCGGDMLPRRLWKVAVVVVGRLAGGVLGALEAELAGDLLA